MAVDLRNFLSVGQVINMWNKEYVITKLYQGFANCSHSVFDKDNNLIAIKDRNFSVGDFAINGYFKDYNLENGGKEWKGIEEYVE